MVKKGISSSVATSSEGQEPVWRPCGASVKSFGLNNAAIQLLRAILVFKDDKVKRIKYDTRYYNMCQ